MKSLTATLSALLLALAAYAPAQTSEGGITTQGGKASDQVNVKIARFDILVKLEPIAFRKSQFPDLLTGIEQARQIERDTLKQEDDDLATLDPDLSKAIKDAIENGIYPPQKIQDEVEKKIAGMKQRRLESTLRMINAVYDKIKTDLNDGQIKAMAGSFVNKLAAPDTKTGEKPDQDAKVRFYINAVLLDPLTYDLLVEMSKHAS